MVLLDSNYTELTTVKPMPQILVSLHILLAMLIENSIIVMKCKDRHATLCNGWTFEFKTIPPQHLPIYTLMDLKHTMYLQCWWIQSRCLHWWIKAKMYCWTQMDSKHIIDSDWSISHIHFIKLIDVRNISTVAKLGEIWKHTGRCWQWWIQNNICFDDSSLATSQSQNIKTVY